MPLSLYVHLPWCEPQCPYCDFSITTDPVNGNDAKLAETIIKDINQSKDLISSTIDIIDSEELERQSEKDVLSVLSCLLYTSDAADE